MKRSPASWVCIALLLACAITPAGAQQPSSAVTIDASRLRLGVDSLAIFLVRGRDTTRIGTVWDELRVIETSRGPRLQRIYRGHNELLGVRLDTIVSTFPSLAPVSQWSVSARSRERLDFSAGRVTGLIGLTDGGSAPVNLELPTPVYSSATFDLLLRAGPLSPGRSVTVPALVPSARTVIRLSADVVGGEDIGSEECWRVDADFAGSAVSFWIGKESRRLCQQVMHLQPGVELLFGAFPRPRPLSRPAA